VRRQAAARSLAWVLSQSPAVVALPGARSPEAVRSAVAALEIELPAPADRARRTPSGAEVRLLMASRGRARVAWRRAGRAVNGSAVTIVGARWRLWRASSTGGWVRAPIGWCSTTPI
jgi:hypothetical protein